MARVRRTSRTLAGARYHYWTLTSLPTNTSRVHRILGFRFLTRYDRSGAALPNQHLDPMRSTVGVPRPFKKQQRIEVADEGAEEDADATLTPTKVVSWASCLVVDISLEKYPSQQAGEVSRTGVSPRATLAHRWNPPKALRTPRTPVLQDWSVSAVQEIEA